MKGRTQTSITPMIEKDRLMKRAKNLSEIKNMNSNSNIKGCQKEAEDKGIAKAVKYLVGEVPKSKDQKEDKNKLKFNNLHATSYGPMKMRNNVEIHNLLINMIQQQTAPEAE